MDGRTLLSKESFKAYKLAEQEKDFQVFIKHMNPILHEHKKISEPHIVRRALRKLKRVMGQLVNN